MMRTEPTRREAIALGGAAAASALSGLAAGADDSLRNHNGVTVRRIGDPDRPTLAVSLPESPDANAAVIELPEHAWRRTERGADQAWFYKMYTADDRLKGKVTWRREERAFRYDMRTPSGFTLAGAAVLLDDGLLISYQIGNPEERPFAELQAPTCIKLYRPFTDVFLERTFVHHSDGLDLLASETPERLRKNAEEWLPCRYIAVCAPGKVAPENRIERDADGITRYRKLRSVDAPFIATASNPSGWVAATHSLDADSVWTNPARTCHHADPNTALPPRGTARLALKLYLLRGGVQEAWGRVAGAHKSGHP